jgi:cyclopropane fatty-acyl-phospholipid synthase-like methyltransferase
MNSRMEGFYLLMVTFLRKPPGFVPPGIQRHLRLFVWERLHALHITFCSEKVDDEIREAVKGGWFDRRSPLVDIGCGDGVNARWLASQGYDVTGIDFSRRAVERVRARAASGGPVAGREIYKVLDVTEERLGKRCYGNLSDRGCFHMLPSRSQKAYATNIAECAMPGAHFLLQHAVGLSGQPPADVIISSVKALMGPFFIIEKIQDGCFTGFDRVRRVSFWMTRREV